MNHYNSILDFNRSFEINNINDSINNITSDKYIQYKKLLNFRTDLINEEVKELNDAIIASDDIEIIDALIDIIYVTIGMCIAIDYIPDFTQIDKK